MIYYLTIYDLLFNDSLFAIVERNETWMQIVLIHNS